MLLSENVLLTPGKEHRLSLSRTSRAGDGALDRRRMYLMNAHAQHAIVKRISNEQIAFGVEAD